MSDFMTTTMIIMSETAAFFAIIIIIVLIFRIRSKIALKRCAKSFVKRIKEEDPKHNEKLKNILLNDYGLDEAQASSAVQSLIEQEHALYSNIIELYLGDKNSNLDDINENVKNLTSVMHGVTVNVMQDAEGTSPDSADSSAGGGYIQQLKEQLKKSEEEKLKVEIELKEAMKRMEGMMTEFASMYAGGAGGDDEKIRDELDKSKLKKVESSEKDTNGKSDEDLNVDAPDLDIDEVGKNS